MMLLLDTHLLLWAASQPDRLSAAAQQVRVHSDVGTSQAGLDGQLPEAGGTEAGLVVLIQQLLSRRGLVDNGYTELAITSNHALAVHHLPPIHRDPFDRLLVAQAESEGMLLLTADATVARYPGPIMRV